MRTRPFGDSSRGSVQVLAIGSEPGPVLEVLDLGATVHRLWVTCGDGVRRNVVLGHATPQEYLDSTTYVGATIGRYANRIKDGRFPLGANTVQVATNERGNSLHGGPEGFDRRLWEVARHTDDQLTLRLTSPRGDQGFPGELIVLAHLRATADGVQVRFEATTDALTVVNLTSHAYFNLDGDGSGSIDDQVLRVAANDYLPVDPLGLPLERTILSGTVFDLREPARLGDVIARTRGLDHNYVLDGSGPAAALDSPATRTRLELRTDQPGLQVYTGIAFDGTGRSTEGVSYHQGAGLALESQRAPDTPNRPDLGSALLRAGDSYTADTEWRFSALTECHGD